MARAGASRSRIARTLGAGYASGLLSQETFNSRLEEALSRRLIEPGRLIGDLNFRRSAGWRERVEGCLTAVGGWFTAGASGADRARATLLALDWAGAPGELLVGRHYACDVVLSNPSVSRRHARLTFRDGSWVLQDLESTNGTLVNGVRVGRCALRPGDRLVLGDEHLRID